MLLLTLLPVLGTSMPLELATMSAAPASTAALSSLGLLCSAAWYGSGIGMAYYAAVGGSEAMETVVEGMEDVVGEVVDGTKRVIQCVSFGFLFIAAIAVVRMGHCVLAILSEWIARATPSLPSWSGKDAIKQKYGGRLPGGGKLATQAAGLSVADLFGNPSDPPVRIGQVDPSRLNIDDEFSFVYFRGTRAGERRTVQLAGFEDVGGVKQLVCHEIDGKGRTIERNYWPSHTGYVWYPGEDAEKAMERVKQEECRVTAPPLPGSLLSSVSGPSPAAPEMSSSSSAQRTSSSLVTRSKLVLSRQAEDQKAAKEWKAALRSASTPVKRPSGVETGTKFFTGEEMLPVVLEEIGALESSFCGLQYTLDHTDCFMGLTSKMSKGVKGRFVIDRKNFIESSCARQAARVAELWRAGCEFRVLRPRGSEYACMHAKSLVFDEKVVLTGSVNMTHNGLENNKEHMYRITEPKVVAAVLADFEEVWQVAEEVTQEGVDMMVARSEENRKARKERREQCTSRTVSRSLSEELGALSQPLDAAAATPSREEP